MYHEFFDFFVHISLEVTIGQNGAHVGAIPPPYERVTQQSAFISCDTLVESYCDVARGSWERFLGKNPIDEDAWKTLFTDHNGGHFESWRHIQTKQTQQPTNWLSNERMMRRYCRKRRLLRRKRMMGHRVRSMAIRQKVRFGSIDCRLSKSKCMVTSAVLPLILCVP